MARKLFCQLGPAAYRMSALRCRTQRALRDVLSGTRFAREKAPLLPIRTYTHASLIRRRLGSVDMRLQENKAVNLALTAPKVSGVLIHPGETFSFWHLVGNCTEKNGYKEGLFISGGKVSSGIGGGMCQMTNLIHWMALHSDLTITEQHHHDQIDLFPDFGRQIPFGTGTSIAYNYLDYRLYNATSRTYQICVWVDGEYLRGELRTDREPNTCYHVYTENERFVREENGVYRCGTVYRRRVDRKTGNILMAEVLRENHARVMYDPNSIKAGV
ncbi:MAG: VanW family protein [Clostridiaceae bacterium]|nr:VanW family protein [Clostridiaceae bacterium]